MKLPRMPRLGKFEGPPLKTFDAVVAGLGDREHASIEHAHIWVNVDLRGVFPGTVFFMRSDFSRLKNRDDFFGYMDTSQPTFSLIFPRVKILASQVKGTELFTVDTFLPCSGNLMHVHHARPKKDVGRLDHPRDVSLHLSSVLMEHIHKIKKGIHISGDSASDLWQPPSFRVKGPKSEFRIWLGDENVADVSPVCYRAALYVVTGSTTIHGDLKPLPETIAGVQEIARFLPPIDERAENAFARIGRIDGGMR